MNLTEFQQKAIEAAKKQLSQYDWYSGVCIDQIDRIKPGMDFEQAVDILVDDTYSWTTRKELEDDCFA